MDHAKDRAGRLIATHQATAHRFYICPVCSTDVFLRRGGKYEHHFAHRSGYGKPECEHFHPSNYIGTTWATPGDPNNNGSSGRAIAPLSVSLELEPEAFVRGRRLRRWGLRLTVPKSEDQHGRVTIDFGAGSPKTLALTRLSLESYTAVAGLDAPEFGASWISPEVRPEYRHAIEERVPGLDRALVNVFAVSNQKYKPRIDSLTWGTSYYFVWKATAIEALHAGLAALPLAPQDDWRCALVTLPDEEESDLNAWIAEFAGLNFKPPRRTFGVIYPAPCGIDVFGRPVIPETGEILVGLNLGQADDDNGRRISCSIGRDQANLSISSAGRHLFEIETALGKNALTLKLDEVALPQLAAFDASSDPIENVVSLELRYAEANETHSLDLHRRKSATTLREARAGGAEITSLTYPRGYRGFVRSRSPLKIEWQSIEVSSASLASSAELQEINSAFQNRSLDISFDFGSFGTFHDSGSTTEPATTTICLSPSVRSRVVWLCKSAHHFVDDRKRAIESISDEHLLAIFHSIVVPVELVAHKTAVSRSLQRWGGQR